MTECPIVSVQTFIEAVRDSGYKNTATAVAELVDNSIEAGATTVQVDLVQNETGEWILRVLDDGCGMLPSEMQVALQFGGSTRFNSRTGAGRYGMGLPCSSLSRGRRLDLFSWRNGNQLWWTYLDVDEIANGKTGFVPQPIRMHRKDHPELPPSESGTAVYVSRCDRLNYKKRSTISEKLSAGLSRIFRKPITSGKIIQVNGERLRPIDPLFLDPAAAMHGATPFGPPLEFPIRLPGQGRSSIIRVSFAELPVQRWHALPVEAKATSGILKGAGVSVLRSGREIDTGWFFMGDKRKENYDDWWRCQVEFEPVLDELFGVTHTKQKINPNDELNRILSPHVAPIARELNKRVRQEFLNIRAAEPAHSKAGTRAAASDVYLDPPPRQRTQIVTSIETKRRGLQYQINAREVDDDNFFIPDLCKHTLCLDVNALHKFYGKIYAPLTASKGELERKVLANFELVLLAFARAECGLRNTKEKEVVENLRCRWGQILNTFLD